MTVPNSPGLVEVVKETLEGHGGNREYATHVSRTRSSKNPLTFQQKHGLRRSARHGTPWPRVNHFDRRFPSVKRLHDLWMEIPATGKKVLHSVEKCKRKQTQIFSECGREWRNAPRTAALGKQCFLRDSACQERQLVPRGRTPKILFRFGKKLPLTNSRCFCYLVSQPPRVASAIGRGADSKESAPAFLGNHHFENDSLH